MILFSVVMSVYKNDNPIYVRVALDSIFIDQTIKPADVVLVRDGRVSTELDALLEEYESQYKGVLNIIRLKENLGLGNALRLGVENAKYEIIARMDSDDICVVNRFEKQIAYFESNPSISIIGGLISEFIDNPRNVVGHRICPLTDSEIRKYMKKRCAMNHVTVMFRKSEVLCAGNYQDWFWNEDYYLWIRMMLAGCKFANLPDVLVNVRVGYDMYARRGGWRYFKSEASLQLYMWQHGVIVFSRYIWNVIIRFVVQVLIPTNIRGWLFRTYAREHN